MRYWAVVLISFVLGCGPTPYYSERHELETEGWPTDEKLSFVTQIDDTESFYNLHLIVEHLQAYSYENIYLKIQTTFPNKEVREEQLSIDLADKKGVWVGQCSGDNCKCKVYLLENFKFPEIGGYTFELRQYTRDENLAGITSLEMQLYKVVQE